MDKCPLCEGSIRNKRCTFCGMPYYGEDKTVLEYNKKAQKAAKKKQVQIKKASNTPSIPKKNAESKVNRKTNNVSRKTSRANEKISKKKSKKDNPILRVIKFCFLCFVIINLLMGVAGTLLVERENNREAEIIEIQDESPVNVQVEIQDETSDVWDTQETLVNYEEFKEFAEQHGVDLEQEPLEEAVYKKLTEEDGVWNVQDNPGIYRVRIYEGSTTLVKYNVDRGREEIQLSDANNEIVITLYEDDNIYLKESDELDRCVELYQIR